MSSTSFIILIVALVIGGAAGYFYRKKETETKNKDLNEKSEQVLQQANAKAKEVLLEARNEAFKTLEKFKQEEEKKREQIEKIEERLISKEEALDQKNNQADNLKTELESKVTAVKSLREEVQKIHDMQGQELQKIAGLSRDEAKTLLFKQVEEDYKADLVVHIQRSEKELQDQSKERAKFILADAVQKYAAETATESTATVVTLPSDDLKGRIIGREGRNINTFEEATGIDVIVDDTPGSIVISGFDLVRRYIAKIALERLITDGRIHPARIEETVQKVKEEVNTMMKELGEKAAYETSVAGLHPNLIKLLGRLKFRTSFGQNVLKHSMEVSFLAANLASELGADVNVCRKAGLLHDIGKAVDHEIQGHHAQIGRDIAKKFGMPDAVVHAIESHHGDPAAVSLEAMIVQAANSIANTRPGANKENLDSYVKRLEEIENTASSFAGVSKVFAVQAGAEVRVFVSPTEADDLSSVKLSHDIARKIERDLQYPGQIKVLVIRETRAEKFAV
ncbi:MAG: ribonuclease Y [Candidatus Gracilibacteria bacterium]|jgi:ribonuclease Y